MIKVGITGGIGSGKTTVCGVFELLGIPVYYSDEEAKLLLDTNSSVKKDIVKVFGDSILTDSKNIDRKKLSALVFSDASKLNKLNSIVHPAVKKHFEDWAQKNRKNDYILKEAAILFESDAFKQVDMVIVVAASKELKIQRVMQRNALSREQIEQRIKAQMSDEEKIENAQFVIYNDEEQLLIPQIIYVHSKILKFT